ncbi:MAG: nucleotidyl transferase AbiEii/AbiGii toxin family protein, partial [Bdellovibrionales bacterium]
MTTKTKGESIRTRLIKLSAKCGVRYENLVTIFLIERLVARLVADKSLAQHLVFKGGFVGLKIYESPRYTIDLDALLVKSNIEDTLKLVKEKAESDLVDGVWFRFESQV